MYSNSGIWVIGNVVNDKVFYNKGEGDKQSFCSFRVAVQVEKDAAVFMPVKCFGFTADNCSDLSKGTKVLIVGRVYEDAWIKTEGENAGKEMKSVGIIAENVGRVTVNKKEEF